MRLLRAVGCALLFPVLSTPCLADVVVTRSVQGDSFSPPAVTGATRGCPAGIARPVPGQQVRLSVAPEMARRDEPSISFMLRLDLGRVFILHHGSRTYSELSYPLKLRDLETSFRASMGSAASEVFPYHLQGTVREGVNNDGGHNLLVRSATVARTLGSPNEVEVRASLDPSLGRPALAVEAVAQAIRGAGEEWLSLLVLSDAIPLSISTSVEQPEAVVHYREMFVKADILDIEAGDFAVPADYSKVKHVPDCFYFPW